MAQAESFDVVVVGAGPIGIETAIVLARDGLSVVVLDAGPIGATIARTFPPQTRFFTSPERLAIRGLPLASTTQEKATGEDYLAYLRSVVQLHDVDVRTYQEVVSIDGGKGAFRVRARDDSGRRSTWQCSYVVLATGGTDAPRRLGVPGEDLPIVSSYLGDPHRYFRRRVVVVGGRNSAAESALRLYRAGAYVALVHRQADLSARVKFWIRPEVESLMQEGVIKRIMPARVIAIDPGLVRCHDLDRDVTVDVAADNVLLQIGFEQDQTLFRSVGVEVGGPNRAPTVNAATLESNVPGVYVVGTATAGSQSGFTVFIENCHQHADRVSAAIAGRPAPADVPARPLPES